MPDIVTLTFSPCIDKSASVPCLIPEKKLHCTAVKLEPGGGGINVARAIKKLGGIATAVYPSGGYTGKFFNHLLAAEQIPSMIIHTINETRENIIIWEEKNNLQFRFGMPASALLEDEWKQCVHVVNEIRDVRFIVVSGSLPPGAPLNVFSDLTQIAERKKAKLVVDTTGNALKEALAHEVYLIKPNIAELCTLAGVDKVSHDRAEEIAQAVIQKYRCRIIVVSLGKDGALLVTENERYKVIPPAVIVKSTVGAGDSMVAGIVYCLANGSGMKNALQYGVACGTAATMNPGTELCYKEDAEALYEIIKQVSKD